MTLAYTNLIKNSNQPFNLKENIRNLIIIGRNNSGKSTLANIIEKSVSDETRYHVVDPGVTKLTKNIVKLLEGTSQLLQLLFVIDEGKFMKEEVEAISNSGIDEHITIVRTKFSNFKNEGECKKDKECLEDLYKEDKTIAKLCKNIVYVDNPPINFSVIDDDDDKTNEINMRKRDQSRDILLKHLDKVIQEKYYKLKIWDKLHSKIAIGNIAEEVERNLKLEFPELNLNHFEQEVERVNYIEKVLTS